jgi:hypothetical protein
MIDPNHDNFDGRLGRIERLHAAGAGFEAKGTLGKSYYTAHRQRRRSHRLLSLALVIATVLLTLKASMLLAVGSEAYDYRVQELRSGSTVDQIGAMVLQADPVSGFIAVQMRRIIP